MRHLVAGLVYVIGIGLAIYVVPSLRALSVSLFAGAGVLALILGFASQSVFANIVSGIFIAIFKPFRVGDVISVKNYLGTVEDITLKHTVIRSFENKRIIIPNSLMNSEVIENANIEDENICKFVEVGISYDSSIDNAMKIMAREAQKHPLFLDHRTDDERKEKKPAVVVRVLGFSDSAIKLRAWVWAKTPGDAFILGCDLNKSIKEAFDKAGIEIPFPYRTIVYKNKKHK
ncbi:MAG: mechanosensitive ion channel family protein [Candidatus Woesearchaeota archaeon]|nr:MAG: mechanosensitive ion channel family protein [Candidatus Woesearchaeota archaeon]